MRLSPAALLPVLALSVLVACGGDDDEPAAASTSSSPTSGENPPGAENPGKVLPLPAPGTCEPVTESADGRYVVGEAGVVTLRLEEGEVQLDVSSSNGWGTMAAHTPIQAVVTFTRGDEVLALEAEREDGRLVLRICDDD